MFHTFLLYQSESNNNNNHIGPMPPPPPNSNGINRQPSLPPKKIQPDPDYEIIEFSGQQYSNAAPLKTGIPAKPFQGNYTKITLKL